MQPLTALAHDTAQAGDRWEALWRERRDAALLSGVNACAAFIPPMAVGLSSYMIWFEPETQAVRLTMAAAFVGLCVLYWLAHRCPVVRRHALPYALSFVVALVGITTCYFWALGAEQSAVISIVVFVVEILGSPLLFPWGVGPQSLVCATALIGYGAIVGRLPAMFHPLSLGMLVCLTPLVLLATRLITGYRKESTRNAWQADQLVMLARALGGPLEAVEVSRIACHFGTRLVAADGSCALLGTEKVNTYRVEVCTPAETGGPWVGHEVTDDFGIAERIAERDVLILPGDDPENPILSLLREAGHSQAIYALARDGDAILGIFSFTRKGDEPFGDADRSLMRAVVDQTTLALRTARVVNDLRQISQLKSEFVSTISHELRTPLNVILGFAEMARDLAAEPLRVTDCLGRIEGAGHELLDLIESTLEVGRIEAERADVRVEPLTLPAFWEELGKACLRFPRRPGVVLRWETAPAVSLQTDPRKLTIIVRNLVGNALKFTERGQVSAEIVSDGGRTGIRVADSGIGIRTEDQGPIFEMFRQADGSDARRYGGAGLGLYIVRRYVQQLGGEITLESTVGIGTTFTVWLSCREPVTAAPAAA